MNNCNACISLIGLIEKGCAENVTCYDCNKSLKHVQKITSFKPTVSLTKSTYRAPKKQKQQISKRHYNNLYHKYATNWGSEKTHAWLKNKFLVMD